MFSFYDIVTLPEKYTVQTKLGQRKSLSKGKRTLWIGETGPKTSVQITTSDWNTKSYSNTLENSGYSNLKSGIHGFYIIHSN